MITIYCAIRPPKITGWVVEGNVGSSGLWDEEEDVTEISVKLAVTNRRQRKAAVLTWTLKVDGDPREHQALSIPDNYVACRPGYDANLKPIPNMEPMTDLRLITSHQFKVATGWLHFAFRGDQWCGCEPRIQVIATDQNRNKHRIKGQIRIIPGFWVGARIEEK